MRSLSPPTGGFQGTWTQVRFDTPMSQRMIR